MTTYRSPRGPLLAPGSPSAPMRLWVPLSTAGGVAGRGGARPGAGAVADRTDVLPGKLKLLRGAEDRFLELQGQVVAQVGAPPRGPAAASTSETEAEGLPEDVGEAEAEIGGDILEPGGGNGGSGGPAG